MPDAHAPPDIVERLQTPTGVYAECELRDLRHEGAAEITRLRAALAEIEDEAIKCRRLQGAEMPAPGTPGASYGYGKIGLAARAAREGRDA